MGFYNKGLNISPSLVSMTGGLGRGAKAFGDSLVNLGADKIAKAKADALKKEKLAKIQAISVVNGSVDPTLAKKLQDRGLGGLVTLTAPKVLQKDIRINGKNYIANYNLKTKQYENTGQLSANQPTTQKTQFSDRRVGNKNYVFKLDPKTGQWTNTGQLSANQPTTQKTQFSDRRVGNKNYVFKLDPKTGQWTNTGQLSANQPTTPKVLQKDIRINGKNYIANYNPKTKQYENTGQLSANQPNGSPLKKLIKEQSQYVKGTPTWKTYQTKIDSYSKGNAGILPEELIKEIKKTK